MILAVDAIGYMPVRELGNAELRKLHAKMKTPPERGFSSGPAWTRTRDTGIMSPGLRSDEIRLR